MKRLLVLLLVLGLAANAQAMLSLSINGTTAPDEYSMTVSTTILIDVYSTNNAQWTGYLQITGGDPLQGEWVAGTMWMGPIAGTAAGTVGEWGYASSMEDGSHVVGTITEGLGGGFGGIPGVWELNAGGVAVGPQAGKQFEVVFHCLHDTPVVISLWDDSFGENEGSLQDSILIQQIPEPMTMGLLALGGLFLRRRK